VKRILEEAFKLLVGLLRYSLITETKYLCFFFRNGLAMVNVEAKAARRHSLQKLWALSFKRHYHTVVSRRITL